MIDSIESIIRSVREEMIARYGEHLAGHCIEASEKIVGMLNEQLTIHAVTVEGWCRYDDESYGSDRPWDPHTWVEIPSLGLYIDASADQFNCGMYPENEYPDVMIQKGLPYGMQYEEPTWDDFELQSAILSCLDQGVHPDKKNSLESLIESASSRVSELSTKAAPVPER